MVLQITAPQPSSNALPMTLAFVPGGPEPTTNGLGNFRPSTMMLRSDIVHLDAVNWMRTPWWGPLEILRLLASQTEYTMNALALPPPFRRCKPNRATLKSS